MNKQARAIALADQLKERYGATVPTSQAAAELRRLHELNAELLESLEWAITHVPTRRSLELMGVDPTAYEERRAKARAVIAKAEAA